MIAQGGLFHIQQLEVEQDLARARLLMDLEGVPPVPLLGARVLGAFLKGQLVGAVVAEQVGQALFLSSLVVRDIFRGVGVGKELVKSLIRFGRERGLPVIYVAPRKAAHYFEKLGFHRASKRAMPGEVLSHPLLRTTNGLKIFSKNILFYDMPPRVTRKKGRLRTLAPGVSRLKKARSPRH